MTAQAALVPDRKLPLPSWLPPEKRRALAGRRMTVTISPAVRTRMRTKERIPVSDWNERYRIMPSADSLSGHWRRTVAPHAAKVMDTWALPWVREVWFCGPDQASKTNAMLGCLGWSIDRDPGNIFYTMPSEAAAKKIWSEKLIPMLRLSRPLAGKLSPRADDTGLGMIRMVHGVSIYPAWANSATSTATFSAKYTFNDEVDKWEMVGAETDPIRRIRKRAKNFKHSHKHFFASTPAGKYIHKGMLECQQVWEYAARCPDCGELVIMDEEHFVIPDGWGAQEIKANRAAIEYSCSCGCLWGEAKREAAFRWGAWVCVKGADVQRPTDVGFHLSGFVTPDMKMSDIAITIVAARGGDLSAKRDLAHGIKAVDYKEETKERQEDAILRLCDDRPAGQVHPESDILEISIDTQDHGFWYRIRGWRYGQDLKSWLVKCGYVPSSRPDDFSALDQLIFDSVYRDGSRKEYRISYGIIDSQGHRTAEVYAWCKRTGIFASRGAQRRKAQPVTTSRQDFFPGTNKPIQGGLILYHLDTHFHKDALANKLMTDPSDDGAMVLHSGYSAIQQLLRTKNPQIKLANGLDDYAKQMCAEYRDEKGLWVCPEGKANHLFDCEQMGLALAMYLGFQNMVREERQEELPEERPTASGGRPGWFNNRGRQ